MYPWGLYFQFSIVSIKCQPKTEQLAYTLRWKLLSQLEYHMFYDAQCHPASSLQLFVYVEEGQTD